MTEREELTLQLGFLVQEEEQERKRDEQQTQAGRHSTPRYASNREALEAYEKKLNNQSYQ